jgi:hypothetical protein
MAKQTINIGASPNDGTGTPLRTSFDYCNLNFTELYTAVGPSGNNIVCPGSATITGALTVDTTTLVVDPTNDRVGIGTATPAAKLIVRDGSNRNLLVSSDATQLGSAGIAIGSFTDNAAGYAPLSIIAGTSMAFGMNGTTAMTLNSTGLGVGVTPAVRFDSLVADAVECARFRAASGWLRIYPYVNATDVCRLQSVNNTNSGLQTLTLEGLNLRFNTNTGNAVIIDNLGNTISNVNSAVPSLATNSQMVFNLTSNTNLRISVRGADGTTRTANITLA